MYKRQPHGDTEIETGDLVTIVLQSGAFSNVINLFSGSESRFPLEFGKDVFVILENENNLKNLSESEFYIRNTKAASLQLLTKEDLFENKIVGLECCAYDYSKNTQKKIVNSIEKVFSSIEKLKDIKLKE